MFRGRLAIVTKDVCKEWINVGPDKIQDLLRSKIDEHEKQVSNGDPCLPSSHGLARMLHEVVWQALVGIISIKDVCALLLAVELNKYNNSCDTFLDCLWVIGNEVENAEPQKHKTDEWNRLCLLIREAVQSELVSAKKVGEILELDVFAAAGLVANINKLKTKLVRTNTKILYTQRKYNLIKEETEGFSKVLCLLNEGIHRKDVKKVLSNLYALIGYFDLEPNRVFDLVLEAFELNPSNAAFLDLLSHYKRSSLPQLLGFKFQYYQRPLVSLTTPFSLYHLTALLISHGLLQIEDILPHLVPDLPSLGEAHQRHIESLLLKAKQVGTVNLSSKKKHPVATHDSSSLTSKDAENKVEEDYTKILLSDKNNQIYGLVQGFLFIGHWDLAKTLIMKLKLHGADPVFHPSIAKAICQLIHQLIKPLYAPLSFKSLGLVIVNKSLSPSNENSIPSTFNPSSTSFCSVPVHTTEEFFTKVQPILLILGSGLHLDCLLFTKICRLLKSMLEKKEITNQIKDAKATWYSFKQLICCSLLESLSLVQCNIGLVHELWALLSLLPFSKRYSYYELWRKESYKTVQLALAKANTEDGTKKLLRRISNDTVKKMGRKIGKIAHSNPIVVFDTIFSQIEVYDNMIQPVVDALRFLTSFGFDVLSYTLICHLASDRSKLKEDGTNTSQWLSSLSQFCGCVYRKYPIVVELQGLLHYLIERLKCSQSIDLLVLAELLTKMGSCVTFEDVSEMQLEARAGGRSLALAVEMSVDPKLANRRAIPKLRDALVKTQLVVPLLVLIAQQRSHILYRTETLHMKLVGRLYDTSQMTLIQLCDFLETSVDPKNYQSMLPSLHVLCTQFRVDPDVAMRFCRPAIRAADSILGGFTEAEENKVLSADARKLSPWLPYSDSFLQSIQKVFTDSSLSPKFYCTFWAMKLCDVHFPRARYDAEVTSRNNMYKSISHKEDMTESKRRKEHERHIEMISKLQREMNHQKNHTKKVLDRLDEIKDSFFPESGPRPVDELLQHCVIPRMLSSPEDALFCAKFMEILHSKDPVNFCSLKYYFDLTQCVPPLVLCCTEREAANLGIFLKETLALLNSWKNLGEFTDKAASKRCFSVSMSDSSPLPHTKFKVLLTKINQTMVDLYVKTLQSSSEYMNIRNSLIVLTRIISVFPVSRSHVDMLASCIEALKEEKREDLKIMALGYSALLAKQRSILPEEKESKFVRSSPLTPLPPPAPPSASRAPTTSHSNTSNLRSTSRPKSQKESSPRSLDDRPETPGDSIKLETTARESRPDLRDVRTEGRESQSSLNAENDLKEVDRRGRSKSHERERRSSSNGHIEADVLRKRSREEGKELKRATDKSPIHSSNSISLEKMDKQRLREDTKKKTEHFRKSPSSTTDARKRNRLEEFSSDTSKRIRKEEDHSIDKQSAKAHSKEESNKSRSTGNSSHLAPYQVVEANTRRIEEEKKQRLKQKSSNPSSSPNSHWGHDADDNRWSSHSRGSTSRLPGNKGDRREFGHDGRNDDLRMRDEKALRHEGERSSLNATLLVANFDPSYAGGVEGKICCLYSNLHNSLEADIQVLLDISHLDQMRLQSKYPDCNFPISSLLWHIHVLWKHTKRSGYLSDCSPENTGGHFDPTFACAEVSQYAKEPVCTTQDLQYSCTPNVYQLNPMRCEVGDLSGKHGPLKFFGSVISNAVYHDVFFPPAASFNHPMFNYSEVDLNIVLHLNCPSHRNPRISCAKLQLTEGMC